MKQEILSNLHNPTQLERLYRADKSGFRRAFNALSPELTDESLTGFWKARLNFAKEEISWGTGKGFLFVVISILLAGTLAKLPDLIGLDKEVYYPRNISFILFPFLATWFIWKNKLSAGKVALIAGAMLAGLIFINALPDNQSSSTLMLSCIHLAIFQWFIVGFAFVGEVKTNTEKRLGFLHYNGDLVVMTTLIMIAAGILSGATIGLFSLIGYDIEKFYFENVIIFGLPAAPILANYLVQSNPQLVGKISPVIAKIFSPLVLVMLSVFLVAIIYSGKNPYNDRDSLAIFNALLIGVMAIIFFSVAGSSGTTKNLLEVRILFLLSIVTIIANGIALSAILVRISEWGITPNRMAVLGANLLILVNLLIVSTQLFRVASKRTTIATLEKSISWYLPVYCVWAFIVTFLFPFFFGYQ